MTHITHAATIREGIDIAFGDIAKGGGPTHVFTNAWLR